MSILRQNADRIVIESIRSVLPDTAVRRVLEGRDFGTGRLVLVAVGKAAWQMARAAVDVLGDRIDGGVVVTKYGHSRGTIHNLHIVEAGHPVPDENSFRGAREALRLVRGLAEWDQVLFLLSGGGSALFEDPLIPPDELEDLTRRLLACGADIMEINTLRKRVSGVKGGRFALACAPAGVYAILLSDVLGDRVDMIASGPACPDSSTVADARRIIQKYGLNLSRQAMHCLETETPKALEHVETIVTGSVREFCAAAASSCRALGYEPVYLTDHLCCEAREAGSFLGSIARSHAGMGRKTAFIAGGETVVHLTGRGKGGRNQELALAAADQIRGVRGVAVFSVGSDGTDGPTDAAGGFVDGGTADALAAAGITVFQALRENDAYHALARVGGLIKTGATGTNVNDVSVALIQA